MNPPKDQNPRVKVIVIFVLALALVLPAMGAIIYGVASGRTMFWVGALISTMMLGTAYFVLLRVMMRRSTGGSLLPWRKNQ